jgi:rhamnose transport system substrate-binding protein
MMPRCKGALYSACCREGAQEAARELDADLVWDAPNEPDPTAQVDILQIWLDSQLDVIAVAASDPHSVSCVLREAQARGIPIVAWDSDTEADARSIFVSPIEADVISRILADEAADLVDGPGDIAVFACKCDGAFESFRKRLLEKRPDLKLCAVRFGADERDRAFSFTRDLLRFCPSLRLVVSLSPLSIRGAAAAVSLSGREKVKVIGVGLPASGGPHVGAGVTPINDSLESARSRLPDSLRGCVSGASPIGTRRNFPAGRSLG